MGVVPGIRLMNITDETSSTLMVGERPPPDTLQAGWWYSRVVSGHYCGGLCGPTEAMLMEENSIIPGEVCIPPFRYGPGRTHNPCGRYHFWSLHPGGGNFLFAAGSVRFVPYTARDVMPALAMRAGGEIVALPD
jgi:hypothetical protein